MASCNKENSGLDLHLYQAAIFLYISKIYLMTSSPYDSLVTIGISTFLRKYTDEKVVWHHDTEIISIIRLY